MAAAEDTNSTQNPSGSDAPKLSDLLDRGWKLYDEVDTTNESSSSNAVQVKVKRGIMQLEEATRMVNQLNLFRLEEHTQTRSHDKENTDCARSAHFIINVVVKALQASGALIMMRVIFRLVISFKLKE